MSANSEGCWSLRNSHAGQVASEHTADRQTDLSSGFNKYYPPDYDPDNHKSLNSYRGDVQSNNLRLVSHDSPGKHALGDRARKIDKGILITRFELPFNIWWYVSFLTSSCCHFTAL